jgi:hypothetical protein
MHPHHHHSGSCQDEHDHTHDNEEDAVNTASLYQFIDFDQVEGFNLDPHTPAKDIFKPWNERLNDVHISSDSDEQILIHVPFTGMVKLQSIYVRGLADDTCPSLLKVFVNTDHVDFDHAESTPPTQEWALPQSSSEIGEYRTKMSKFTSVRNITLYFPTNYGGDVSKLLYIGMKGEFTKTPRNAIITIFEASPNPADHAKLKDALANANNVR